MAADSKAMADVAAYDFRGRYRFDGLGVRGGLDEVAERACMAQPDVLAFAARNGRPSSSAQCVYAEYLMREGALGEHRHLLALIQRDACPADPCEVLAAK